MHAAACPVIVRKLHCQYRDGGTTNAVCVHCKYQGCTEQGLVTTILRNTCSCSNWLAEYKYLQKSQEQQEQLIYNVRIKDRGPVD